MSQMQTWSATNFGMDIFVAYRLEELLKEAGFENVQKTQFDLGNGALAREAGWKQRSAGVMTDTLRALGANLPEGGILGIARDVDEYNGFLDKLHAEFLEYGYRPKLNFVIGQRLK
ncbi:hypothetical protein C8A01DRAFT_34359 [Parachaetomium inaequale]|uniref:Methyltransferase n=1 Tax=Parachaetomium inaequale TaxID=2588326 RepID=A0AAN6PIJ6_9PEZI|nr:hypothetical protein C8A01DRAFT_34359 [Parachaetomium inaequale]